MAEVTFEQVERELCARHFGILNTLSRGGRPHSTGVVYGVSPSSSPLKIYITTRTGNRKVRNIRENPNVSFVVPLTRRLLTFVPPNCIQFQGKARILAASDETAIQTFQSSYILRMILRTEHEIVKKGGGEACFIQVTPDPVIFTYGLGVPVWKLRSRALEASAKVEVPAHRFEA